MEVSASSALSPLRLLLSAPAQLRHSSYNHLFPPHPPHEDNKGLNYEVFSCPSGP